LKNQKSIISISYNRPKDIPSKIV